MTQSELESRDVQIKELTQKYSSECEKRQQTETERDHLTEKLVRKNTSVDTPWVMHMHSVLIVCCSYSVIAKMLISRKVQKKNWKAANTRYARL